MTMREGRTSNIIDMPPEYGRRAHFKKHGSQLHSSAKHALPVDITRHARFIESCPCSHKADSGVAS